MKGLITFKQFLEESKAGVAVAQSKKTQKKLRDAGHMEAPGHYHKKGQDWEDTTVIQPKKKKKLVEVFDTKFEWGEFEKARGDYTVLFKDSAGDEINVQFLNQHRPRQEWYEVEFSRAGDFGITGGGDAPKIFSTVIEITKSFMEKFSPDVVSFSAKSTESSRVKFYDRFVKKIVVNGYKLETVDDGGRFKEYRLAKRGD